MEGIDDLIFVILSILVICSILVDCLGIHLLYVEIQTSVQNILLINLSFVEVLLLVTMTARYSISGTMYGGIGYKKENVVIKVLSLIFAYCYSVWTLTIIGMAIDRVFGVYWPFRRHAMATKKFFTRIVIAAWSSALIISIFYVIFPSKYAIIWISHDAILLAAIFVSYSLVLKKLVKRNELERGMSQSRASHQRNIFRSNAKFFKVCGIILLQYVLLQVIPNIIEYTSSWSRNLAAHIITFMQASSFLVSPLVYIFLLPNIRALLVRKIRRLLKCCRNQEDAENPVPQVAYVREANIVTITRM